MADRAARAFSSSRIREMFWSRCELSVRVHTLQMKLQSELLAENYRKVSSPSYAAAEKMPRPS